MNSTDLDIIYQRLKSSDTALLYHTRIGGIVNCYVLTDNVKIKINWEQYQVLDKQTRYERNRETESVLGKDVVSRTKLDLINGKGLYRAFGVREYKKTNYKQWRRFSNWDLCNLFICYPTYFGKLFNELLPEVEASNAPTMSYYYRCSNNLFPFFEMPLEWRDSTCFVYGYLDNGLKLRFYPRKALIAAVESMYVSNGL